MHLVTTVRKASAAFPLGGGGDVEHRRELHLECLGQRDDLLSYLVA